jgi:hypothetical protein
MLINALISVNKEPGSYKNEMWGNSYNLDCLQTKPIGNYIYCLLEHSVITFCIHEFHMISSVKNYISLNRTN